MFEIFDVEEYRDLTMKVTDHSHGQSMHDLYSAEVFRPMAVF